MTRAINLIMLAALIMGIWTTTARFGVEPPALGAPTIQVQEDALAMAAATNKQNCWTEANETIPGQIIVKWDETGKIERIPFTDETYAQGQAGEFWTLQFCS